MASNPLVPSHSSSPILANERTSLLPRNADLASGNAVIEEEAVETKASTALWLRELLLLLRGSIPVILAYALQNSLQTFSVLIVGRLSPEALATSALSYMFAMCSAWLVALGGSTALDTLASSSYTGSQNPHDLGILLQKAFIVLTLFYIPIAILWACSEPVFRILGQEEYICIQSARFLTALIPGGLGYIYFESIKKYLQAQGPYIYDSPSIQLTRCNRNNACRKLCTPDYVANQCSSQLYFCVYI